MKKRSLNRWHKIKYVRESACSCGFPALNGSVPLGTVYELNLCSLNMAFSFKCGGCGGKVQPVVWARRKGTSPGWLPADIFDLP